MLTPPQFAWKGSQPEGAVNRPPGALLLGLAERLASLRLPHKTSERWRVGLGFLGFGVCSVR